MYNDYYAIFQKVIRKLKYFKFCPKPKSGKIVKNNTQHHSLTECQADVVISSWRVLTHDPQRGGFYPEEIWGGERGRNGHRKVK